MSKLKENDEFGNRMKEYEAVETARRLDVHKPICARIDGRSFSRFTRGMQRPYDEAMSGAMVATAAHLVDVTHARIGYTQSDEISLVWLAEHETADIFFSGKVQKMASVLASIAAAKFALVCPAGYEDRLPHFDCRVFGLPNTTEAMNVFLWRAMDARKNAISMAAQAVFSSKQLHGKRQRDMLEMLSDAGIDFDAYPPFFRNGTFLRRRSVERQLSAEELAAIPERHRPTGPVVRTEVEAIADVFLRDVEDREAFIFGSKP
jgi:tRNA(His) guanylyltransferase